MTGAERVLLPTEPDAAGIASILLELEDRMRPLRDPAAVLAAAGEVLGRALGAGRIRFLGIDEAAGIYRATADWPGGAPPGGAEPAGPLAGLEPGLSALRAGEAVVGPDLRGGLSLLSALGPGGIEVPVLRLGRLVAVLAVARTSPRAWTDAEIALARAGAGRAWAAAERARAEARLRQSEASARARADEIAAIYASAPIGLCVLDREGRYVRINDLLAESNGVPAADHLGRTVREVLPGLADEIEPVLARVLAGEELRGIEFSGTTPRQPGVPRTWRESWVPLRGADGRVAGATIAVEEITRAKAAERRQAYLLRLEERLRAASTAEEAVDAACEVLGQELGATHAGLERIEEDGVHTLVENEWHEAGTPATLGRIRLADLGPWRLDPSLRARTAVVEDVLTDPRTADPVVQAAWAATGARSAIDVPLLREGRVRGIFYAGDARPRAWTEEEVALVRETADRTWQAAERARAEAELRDSEARFRQLAEAIREVFYIYEVDEDRLSYVNPAYEEVWGRPLAEIRADASSFMAVIHPDDRPLVRANLERLRRGESVEGEYRLLRADGSLRHIRDRATLAADPVTGRRRAIGLAADVTERRRVEERLHLATGAADLGIFDVNLVTLQMEWDARQRALWGVSRDAVIIDEIFQAGVHPEDRPIMQAAVARSLDPGGDGLYRAEYRIRPLDGGEERWIAAMGRAHFEGGRAIRLIGTVQDITERKAAEAAMAQSEARFRALAGTVPALIFVTDAEGATLYVNEWFSDFTGLPARDLLGDGWRTAIHPDDLPRVAQAWGESLSTGQDYTVECRLRRADGTWRWHLARGNPVRDAAGRIVQWVGTGTDIDGIVEARESLAESRATIERANAELEARVAERTASLAQANTRLAAEIERREAAQAALVQAQKLEAVGQLTSGIAHDFNNVIAAIAGGFSVIERRTTDPRLLDVARHGAKAAERGGLLVKQLLAFARQQVLAPRACDLAALLREAEPLIARSLDPGIELTIDCPGDLGEVRIDPVQLEAALINLAVNARDAMGATGRLSIAARACLPGETGRPAELGSIPAVAIDIADTGHGMSPEILSRVIEPFFTTKEPGRGTGLGLAMVHGFVHQSGGALRIESREGAGTTVTLYLPRASDPPEEPAPAPLPEAAGEPQAREGLTVLVVDDDASVRGVTAAQLGDLGYGVAEAGGAEEALAALERCPEIDVVLSDVAMPGMDGIALSAEIRRRRPGLPVLLMTGHADRARLAGEAVLEKPFTLRALASSLSARIGLRGPAGT